MIDKKLGQGPEKIGRASESQKVAPSAYAFGTQLQEPLKLGYELLGNTVHVYVAYHEIEASMLREPERYGGGIITSAAGRTDPSRGGIWGINEKQFHPEPLFRGWRSWTG